MIRWTRTIRIFPCFRVKLETQKINPSHFRKYSQNISIQLHEITCYWEYPTPKLNSPTKKNIIINLQAQLLKAKNLTSSEGEAIPNWNRCINQIILSKQKNLSTQSKNPRTPRNEKSEEKKNQTQLQSYTSWLSPEALQQNPNLGCSCFVLATWRGLNERDLVGANGRGRRRWDAGKHAWTGASAMTSPTNSLYPKQIWRFGFWDGYSSTLFYLTDRRITDWRKLSGPHWWTYPTSQELNLRVNLCLSQI